VFQRPGPASRKRGYKKPITIDKEEDNRVIATNLEPQVDESHDKENGLVDTQPIRTSTSCSSSPRKTPPLQPSPTEVDKAEDSSVTSSVDPAEPKATPIPITDSSLENVAIPLVIDPSAEVGSVPKIEKSVSDDLVNDWEDSDESMVIDPAASEMPKGLTSETTNTSIDCIEASKKNSTSFETIDLSCTVKRGDEEVNALDAISDTTPSVVQVAEEADIVEASSLTSGQLY